MYNFFFNVSGQHSLFSLFLSPPLNPPFFRVVPKFWATELVAINTASKRNLNYLMRDMLYEKKTLLFANKTWQAVEINGMVCGHKRSFYNLIRFKALNIRVMIITLLYTILQSRPVNASEYVITAVAGGTCKCQTYLNYSEQAYIRGRGGHFRIKTVSKKNKKIL